MLINIRSVHSVIHAHAEATFLEFSGNALLCSLKIEKKEQPLDSLVLHLDLNGYCSSEYDQMDNWLASECRSQ